MRPAAPKMLCISDLKHCLSDILLKISEKPCQWLQVDLLQPTFVTGIVTQGRFEDKYGDQRVTSFKIMFANQTTAFQNVTDKMGHDKIRTI